MKTLFRFPLVAIVASLLLINTWVQAQNTPANPPRYKDVVVDNPTAEADMKVVGDYVNALVAGDSDKAKGLLAPGYVGRGPARLDSASAEQIIAIWQGNVKTQQDRKVGFVTQTFNVLSGNLKGHWVSMWGDYTYTDKASGKTVTFPFQLTSRVANGKVMDDRIYYDTMAILTQVGYKVTPPEVAKK